MSVPTCGGVQQPLTEHPQAGPAPLAALGGPFSQSDGNTLFWPPPAHRGKTQAVVQHLARKHPQITHCPSAFCLNAHTYITLHQGLILSLYFLKLYCNILCYILMHFASVMQKMNEMIYNSYLFLLLANSMLYSEKHSPRQVNIMYFSTVV